MMKISNAYFKHPVTEELIKPGEMYQDFDKGAVVMQKARMATDIEPNIKLDNELDNELDTEPDKDNRPYSERGITELKKLAKEAKIEGYTKMEKPELVATLEALAIKNPEPEVKENDNNENS